MWIKLNNINLKQIHKWNGNPCKIVSFKTNIGCRDKVIATFKVGDELKKITDLDPLAFLWKDLVVCKDNKNNLLVMEILNEKG